MPNPVLNEKVFQAAAAPTEADAGWAAPSAETAPSTRPSPTVPPRPTRSARTGVMTVGGTAAATGVLLVLLVAASVVGWNLVTVDPTPARTSTSPAGCSCRSSPLSGWPS